MLRFSIIIVASGIARMIQDYRAERLYIPLFFPLILTFFLSFFLYYTQALFNLQKPNSLKRSNLKQINQAK
jgi:hypothetical protein